MDSDIAELHQLIIDQREARLKTVMSRVEADAAQQSFVGFVAGYRDQDTPLVRYRAGVALPAKSLAPSMLEIGEAVSVFLDQSGLLWVDKI